jgi:hypothetical protein
VPVEHIRGIEHLSSGMDGVSEARELPILMLCLNQAETPASCISNQLPCRCYAVIWQPGPEAIGRLFSQCLWRFSRRTMRVPDDLVAEAGTPLVSLAVG